MIRPIRGPDFMSDERMFLIYDLIYFILAVLYLPVLLLRGKWHSAFLSRFGFFPAEVRQQVQARPQIWFHAVSVGEVMALASLLKMIGRAYPHYGIVLTTVTTTGYQMAQTLKQDQLLVLYAPLDFSFTVRAYLRAIRPVMYVTAETEIWPNMFGALFRWHIPVALINGRLSIHSFRWYRRIHSILAKILREVDVCCMQTAEDVHRIEQLGANPKKIFHVGNMKFDQPQPSRRYQPSDISLKEGERIWIAGSTHPGEEDLVCRAYRRLSDAFPDLRLILAPRHIERVRAIHGLMREQGFHPLLFSKRPFTQFTKQHIMIIDTIGDLRVLYSLATVVFMGKSLVGQGGQNILEPAVYAKPIVVGPFMQNFQQITQLLLRAEGLIQVHDEQELIQQIRALLESPARADQLGERAKQMLDQNRGATGRTFKILADLLDRLPS